MKRNRKGYHIQQCNRLLKHVEVGQKFTSGELLATLRSQGVKGLDNVHCNALAYWITSKKPPFGDYFKTIDKSDEDGRILGRSGARTFVRWK